MESSSDVRVTETNPDSGSQLGSGALELGVLGFVHHPHATFTEFFEDFVMGYGFADHDTLMNLLSIYYSGQSTINSLYNVLRLRGANAEARSEPPRLQRLWLKMSI